MKKTQIQQAIDKINGEIALLVATRDRLVEAQRSQPTRRRRPATATTTGATGSATRTPSGRATATVDGS